jgi:hypothetical protein
MRIDYETQQWLSFHGTVFRDKAVHLHNHYTASGIEDKGSFHASKNCLKNSRSR